MSGLTELPQPVPLPPEHYQAPASAAEQNRLAHLRSLRDNSVVNANGTAVDLLADSPERYKSDTVSPVFRGARQAHAAPHKGSEDEKYVMGVAQKTFRTEDTKTLHAMSLGELSGVHTVDAVELGKTAAETRLGQISLKYTAETISGIATVQEFGAHATEGKIAAQPMDGELLGGSTLYTPLELAPNGRGSYIAAAVPKSATK